MKPAVPEKPSLEGLDLASPNALREGWTANWRFVGWEFFLSILPVFLLTTTNLLMLYRDQETQPRQRTGVRLCMREYRPPWILGKSLLIGG